MKRKLVSSLLAFVMTAATLIGFSLSPAGATSYYDLGVHNAYVGTVHLYVVDTCTDSGADLNACYIVRGDWTHGGTTDTYYIFDVLPSWAELSAVYDGSNGVSSLVLDYGPRGGWQCQAPTECGVIWGVDQSTQYAFCAYISSSPSGPTCFYIAGSSQYASPGLVDHSHHHLLGNIWYAEVYL